MQQNAACQLDHAGTWRRRAFLVAFFVAFTVIVPPNALHPVDIESGKSVRRGYSLDMVRNLQHLIG